MWINLPQQEKEMWNTRAAEGYTSKNKNANKIESVPDKEPEAVVTSENSEEEQKVLVTPKKPAPKTNNSGKKPIQKKATKSSK